MKIVWNCDASDESFRNQVARARAQIGHFKFLHGFCARNVVEVGHAAPQQPPVIRHCVTHLQKALVLCFSKVDHTMSDDWQLLRSGIHNFNNIPCTKPA